MATQYKIWRPETRIDNPIVISLCPEHYNEFSAKNDIEAQEIIGTNTDCWECYCDPITGCHRGSK